MQKFAKIVLVVFLFSFFLSSQAEAQGIHFEGIGGRFGFVDARSTSGTVIFGAHAYLGEFVHGLRFVPSLDFFSKGSRDFISINGNVRYIFPTSGTAEIFVGGGLALIFINTDDIVIGGIRVDGVSDSEVGLNFTGGADFPVSDNLVATGQLIYVTEQAQIKIMAGLTLLLGKK